MAQTFVLDIVKDTPNTRRFENAFDTEAVQTLYIRKGEWIAKATQIRVTVEVIEEGGIKVAE